MAHQSLSQIPDSLRGLILSSAGLQVYFRMNRQDAQLLAKETFEYSGYEVKSEGVSRPVYWSYAEEWEHRIADLQQLPPRLCFVKHKIGGGTVQLHTVGIRPAWEVLEIDEDESAKYLPLVPFGTSYLRPRQMLSEQSVNRQQSLDAQIKAKAEVKPIEVVSRLKQFQDALWSHLSRLSPKSLLPASQLWNYCLRHRPIRYSNASIADFNIS